VPLPSPRKLIGAVAPAGQVTVAAARSMSKSSLQNLPAGAVADLGLDLGVGAKPLEPFEVVAAAVGRIPIDRQPLPLVAGRLAGRDRLVGGPVSVLARTASVLSSPAAWRLATESAPGPPRRNWVTAIMCNAVLTCRLPPRLSRIFSLLPECAGTGAVPLNRA
jgi:hypothetical protein